MGTHAESGLFATGLALVTFVGILVVAGWIAHLLFGFLKGIDSTGNVGQWYLVLGVLMPVLAVIAMVVFAIWVSR